MAKTDDTLTAIELLAEKMAEIAKGNGGITAEQLQQVLDKTIGVNQDAMRALVMPENKQHPAKSVFHPNGIPVAGNPNGTERPKLSRETFFCGVKQWEDSLTDAEILAFNKLTHNTSARGGSWKVTLGKNGSIDQINVWCDEAQDRDMARDLPSQLAILTELAEGPQAVDLEYLRAEVDRLKSQLVLA